MAATRGLLAVHTETRSEVRMEREYLLTLIDFHYWARDRVLAAAGALTADQYSRPLVSSFPSVRETLTHLYLAEWIWYERLQGTSPSARPDVHAPDAEALRRLWTPLEARVRAYAEGLTSATLDNVLEYRLLDGTAGASSLWQVFTHLVNHGSYHRGQVTTLLRQLGAAPAAIMDFAAYCREMAAS